VRQEPVDDVPSNAPGEELTISPHAVTASDTPDNIIASHAGLLVRDADGDVQNFLESLSVSISAPHGTPCAYEACVAFIGGAEAVQRHLQTPHPKVHQWLTTAHELIAELKLKRGSAFASARLSLRGMRTEHPVWVSFVKRGLDGPKNCAATLLLGCAVLLSMEDDEPIGPGLPKQLSNLKPERAISEAQVSSMLSGEAVDIVGMDEGISALRRQWAKVLKKFGSGQPPSPSTPNERARAQVFSAALNCGASRVAGAASHRLLSDDSLKDSFRGVLALLVMRTGLSVDVVASMPLISATGTSADFGLDVFQAMVVLDLRVLVPEASQPLPGSLPARYCLEIQLPSIVKEQLQSRLARYPAAKSLEDLYPETLAPDAKSNVFPSQHEIAPTWSRLRYSLGFALRQQGINKLLVALVCGDFGIVPRSKLHYARVSACEFRAVEQIVYKQLGLGESPGIVDLNAPGIGCAVVPTSENVRQHDELLVQAAQVGRPGKAGDLPLLRTFHNAYTALVAWRLSILLALRETQTIELDAGIDPISDTWIPIHDKTTHRDRGFQPVVLGAYAAMTVLLYQQHCRSTAERVARLAGRSTEFSLWCEAVGHRHNVRLLSFVTGTDEIKGVPSRAFVSPAGLTAAVSLGDEGERTADPGCALQ